MKDQPDSDVAPLITGAHLPATVISIPTAEVLKQILEQVLENERRRVRNEFLRLGLLFLLVVLLILGGGYWFARNLLQQVQAERQLSEITRLNLLQTMALEPSLVAGQPSITTPAAPEPRLSPKAPALEPAAPPPVTSKPSQPQTMAPAMPLPVTLPQTVGPSAPVTAVKPAGAAEPRSTPEPYLKSLVVPVRDDLPLRLPIPSP